MISGVDVLTYTIPDNTLIDFFRVCVAFVGLIHLLFAVHRFLNHQAVWSGVAFMATGLLTMLQQLEAINEPLVPWRLPLYALMNVAGIFYLYRMGRYGTDTCLRNTGGTNHA